MLTFPFAGYDGVPVDEMEGMGIGSHPGSTYGQVNLELKSEDIGITISCSGARHAHGRRFHG